MSTWENHIQYVIDSLVGEFNDRTTQQKVEKVLESILEYHDINASVDCGFNVNTEEVVDNNDFHALICTETDDLLFTIRKEKQINECS